MSRPASTLPFTASRTIFCAFVQHLGNSVTVVHDELWGVLEDGHHPLLVDVCEQFRDGRAARHRSGLQQALILSVCPIYNSIAYRGNRANFDTNSVPDWVFEARDLRLVLGGIWYASS